MKNILRPFLVPAHLFSYEVEQQRRTLNIILWATIAASLALGLTSISFGEIRAGLTILILIPTCLMALYLNAKGYYYAAAVITSTLMFFAAVFDLFEQGSLHDDMGIVAIPVVVAVCGLFLGKRGIYLFSTLSIISVVTIGYLEINKILKPSLLLTTDVGDVVTVVILVLSISILIWVIIDNAEKNLQRIKKHENELRVSYELTLEGLAKALEFRDRETEGHSRRVVVLSVRLAERLGLIGDDLSEIRRGALLHDIGKLAIPDNILLKPGSLDDKEWYVMRQHPVYSMKILADIPFLQSCVCIPYCHHENWDGTGYPRGLKGVEIPLYARIFTVVDHWEALNSDRPYRKAWLWENVLNYIRENRGKIFDPQIIDIFLNMIGSERGKLMVTHLMSINNIKN
jgi:HD-GYP domain-containing protein (c-di-GMP phosphodiesterase class II)